MTRLAVVVATALVVLFLALSIKNVGPDEVALVGAGADVRELPTGINVVLPFRDLRRFRLSQTHRLRADGALRVRPGVGKAVRVELDAEIDLARERIRDLDREYGRAVFEKIVRPTLLVQLAAVLSEEAYPAADLGRLGGEVARLTNERLEAIGVRVSSLVLVDIVEDEVPTYRLETGEGVKVFVLGLDGYDWIVMARVAESVDLPNIRRMMREGAWGNLRSIEPLVSPLIWTTMVTGVTPDIHGITDFLIRDDVSGEDIPVTSSLRRVPAIWNMTGLTDLNCGFIGWFASFPAEDVNGFIVSDRFGYHMFDPRWIEGKKREPERGLTFPAALYAEIESLSVEPAGLESDMSRYLRGPVDAGGRGRPSGAAPAKGPPDPESSLRQIISAYRTYERVMKKLYPDRRPDLFGVYFEFTDSILHLFMKFMKPSMEGVSSADERRYGGAVGAAYAEADRILGDVLDMIDENTVLMVVSDHGFKSGDFRPLSDSRMGFGQAVEWHRLNGVVALYGDIVKPGYEISDASVMDIAPTLLHLLGMPVDRKMTGNVLLEALDDDWVGDHPIRYTSVYDSVISRTDVTVEPSEADQALKDKLISLGYVAGGQNALMNLANFYHTSGKYEEALDLYRQLLDETPGSIEVRIGMSNAYFKMGDEDLALRGLNDVLEEDPRNLEALHSLGNIHVELGRGEEALAVAQRALAVDASDGESHFIKGIALQKLGRYGEAAEAYRRALKLAPDMPEIYGNLATVYVTEGRTEEALELADRALDLAPGRVDMVYIKGMALNAAGRAEEALAQYSKAIGSDPSYVPAYLGAAGIYFARGEFDSVLALSDEALAFPSGYAANVYDVRANAHARLGKYGDAIEDLRAAIRTNPALIGPHLNLARIYISQGRTGEAREVLEDLLGRYPGQREARQLLGSLGPTGN